MSEPKDLSLIERRNAMGVRYHGDTVAMLDMLRQQRAALEDARMRLYYLTEDFWPGPGDRMYFLEATEGTLAKVDAALDLFTEGESHDQRNEPRQDTPTD